MRTIYSFRNIITGIGGQVLTILLQFISRTVFIYTLGKEYLGITSLFTNVLSILSFSELGIGTAVIYSLYKPLAQKDIKKVSVIINFLKKSYFIIGCIIGGLGLSLMPFLPYIMKGTVDLININFIFLLYLFQSVSSYWFFAYKSLLLQADQKKYIVNILRFLISALAVIIQIILLVLYRSFLMYTIVGIISHICTNLIIAKKVDEMYPYILKYKGEVLPKTERKIIFKNLFGVSMYKINSTIVRSTDNIVISAYISTTTVGVYSNYHLIVSTLLTMTRLVFSSFTASIGNLFVSENKEKSRFIFQCLSFFSFWLYGFCAICLWVLFNPFITLWVGKEYLFADYIVFVIVLDFLTDGYQQVSISFKDACGLYWHGRYRPLATALINVVISIFLAPRIGVAGVLLGTIISRLLTTWWFEPWMVHRYAFSSSSRGYFLRYLAFLFLVIIIGGIVQGACIPFSKDSWFNLLMKTIICCLIPNLSFYILFRNTNEFKYILNTINDILNTYRKKLSRPQNI